MSSKKTKQEVKQQKIKDKNTEKEAPIIKSTQKASTIQDIKHVAQKIVSQKDKSQYDGFRLCICSSGSKKVPFYNDSVQQKLNEMAQLQLYAHGQAVSKLVSVVEKIKTVRKDLQFTYRLSRHEGEICLTCLVQK